jgi:hypothetical protein
VKPLPSQVAELEFRVGPGYFRAGGLKGHASQHPTGRRLPCHSCSNSVGPGDETRRGVEFSCVLDMVVSVAGAPWKKEEGSMVKPRCDVRGCSALLEELYSVTPL